VRDQKLFPEIVRKPVQVRCSSAFTEARWPWTPTPISGPPEKRPQELPTPADIQDREMLSNRAANENGGR